jgi:hypothetical protein
VAQRATSLELRSCVAALGGLESSHHRWGTRMGSDEVIRIRLVEKFDGGRWRWSAMFDQPHSGQGRLGVYGVEPGDELVVRVRNTKKDGWVVVRAIEYPDHVKPVENNRHDPDPVAPSPQRDSAPVKPGDVLGWEFPFSKSDGSDRNSKWRPCIVRQILDDGYLVLPVFGTGTFVHRTGGARRILDWKGAGLDKPSVVSAAEIPVPRDAAHRRIGRLSDADRERLVERSHSS